MQSKLAQIFRIQGFLDKIKYPDQYRIAREISTYISLKRKPTEEDIFKRLYMGEPWEYVRGNTQFCNNIFNVSSNALIPRIETEQLVNDCVEIIRKRKIKNIIDVGTGSGCISISISKLLGTKSSHQIYATDISKDALKLAKQNEKNILKTRKIKWITTNLIESIPLLKGNTLLIANLPYIPTKMYKGLDKSVRKFEPRLALDGGENGLTLYENLFEQIKKKKISLKDMYIETEESIFENTKTLIQEYFPKSKIGEIKDCLGRNRFLHISF